MSRRARSQRLFEFQTLSVISLTLSTRFLELLCQPGLCVQRWRADGVQVGAGADGVARRLWTLLLSNHDAQRCLIPSRVQNYGARPGRQGCGRRGTRVLTKLYDTEKTRRLAACQDKVALRESYLARYVTSSLQSAVGIEWKPEANIKS